MVRCWGLAACPTTEGINWKVYNLGCQMTSNKRIFLNVVATYGRSLFALLCGLFTSRWILMALGEVDYGLMGVVGGLTAFISFGAMSISCLSS